MERAKLFPMEYRFMEIVWESAPISAGRLAVLAQAKLDWKRTTSYTVLARLIERGMLHKDGKIVTPLVTKREADETALEELCNRAFGGSYDAMIELLKSLAEKNENAKTH